MKRRWEEGLDTRKSAVLTKIAARLPSIWTLRRKAEARSLDLPDFAAEPELPDADTMYAWIEELCAPPHRRPGSVGDLRGEDWIARQFNELGLKDVRRDPMPVRVWDAERWELRVKGRVVPSFFVPLTASTQEEGITAPLVYVGTGRPRDFQRVDVRGKIAVAEVTFPKLPTGLLMKVLRSTYGLSDPRDEVALETTQYLNFARQNFVGGTDLRTAPRTDVYWESVRRGARAVCLILRDQPSTSNSHYGPYDGIEKPLPGLWIGKGEAPGLRRMARSGAEATLVLRTAVSDGTMHNVWGVLPGRSDEVLIVHSHHDSPFSGAVEDGTGIAHVLAQARAWSRLSPDERPRTLVFVATAGHFYGSAGSHQFAIDHPDLMKRTRVLLTLEHLGAREVDEHQGRYRETGRLAFSVMFTTPDVRVIAPVLRAMRKAPPPCTASIPSDFFAPVPTSDASGMVAEAGVPVVSWIGCPYYLLDEHDTLDKVDRDSLLPYARTVRALISQFMVGAGA